MWNWKRFWRVLAITIVIAFFPGVFVAAWSLGGRVLGRAGDIAGRAYDRATDAPSYDGPTHVVGATVTFDVNRRYRGWGQLFGYRHEDGIANSQLPEISGRVYAERISDGYRMQDAGLRAIVRRNWVSPTRMQWTGSRGASVCRAGRDPDGICVLAPDVRLPVGESSGWRMCVTLHEGIEGHNALGAVQDAASYIRLGDWRLSEGNKPVADECVLISNRGYPGDIERRPVYRYHRVDGRMTPESEPMGWFTMRFDPPLTIPEEVPLAGTQTNMRTSWRD